MSNKFKGFNVEEPSSTRVDIPVPLGADPNRFGNIKQYKPNLIDKISGLIPDTELGGVLKGVYRAVDDGMLGLLPSGNYESSTPETKLGKNIGYLADPFAIPLGGLKTARYAVSGGTPISRLIANSIKPEAYSDKWPELKRVLTNPKVFKEAVIEDIPQWVPSDRKMEDRLFAWRKKLGLGKPNDRYNQILDPIHYAGVPSAKKHIEYMSKNHPNLDISTYHEIVDTYEKNKRIDKIWNKFGKNPDGSYYYKKSEDFHKPLYTQDPSDNFPPRHGLFGFYSEKIRDEKVLDKKTGGFVPYLDYKDNWDFAFNRYLKEYAQDVNQPKKVLLQRKLAELLTKPLLFKGSAKLEY